MTDRSSKPERDSSIDQRAGAIFAEHQDLISRETGSLFTIILAIQWAAGIVLAFVLSPREWSGAQSSIHPHVWAAIFMGGILSIPPIVLLRLYPGQPLNRYLIAGSQMLWSSLLIHITGGRLESHFHIFGSLAFLAFYRDWRVLVCASLVTTIDHFVRGIYWPLSIYGTLLSSPWLWVEHAGWVVFIDIFLIRSCFLSQREMRHIAHRSAVQASLLYQANHDALTGLPNRLFFASRLEEALQQADREHSKVALMFLDLDGFKEINVCLGHQAGDDILKLVSARLSSKIRPSDLVVRLSGDEFALILTGITSAHDVAPIAARLTGALADRFAVGGQQIAVGASMGVCLYPDDAQNSQELQANADRAMYQVKTGGNKGVRYFRRLVGEEQELVSDAR